MPARAVVDGHRVERLQLPDEMRAPLPRRTHRTTKEEVELDEALDAWLFEENLVWGKVVASQAAERLISRRYLGGEDLLYPHSARVLHEVLEHLATARDLHGTMIDRRPLESEEDLLAWVLEKPTKDSPGYPPASSETWAEERPDTERAARSLAEQYVLVARAEALDALGERNAGVRLVENWVRPRDE